MFFIVIVLTLLGGHHEGHRILRNNFVRSSMLIHLKSFNDLIFPLSVQETRFAGDFEGFWEDADQCQTSCQSVRYPCVLDSVPD